MDRHQADLAGDAFPGSTPQAQSDAAQDAPAPAHTSVRNMHWAMSAAFMSIGQREPAALFTELGHLDATRPHAYGTVEVYSNWDAQFRITFSNMALHLVHKRLKKFATDHGWNFDGLVDDYDYPYSVDGSDQKTAAWEPAQSKTPGHQPGPIKGTRVFIKVGPDQGKTGVLTGGSNGVDVWFVRLDEDEAESPEGYESFGGVVPVPFWQLLVEVPEIPDALPDHWAHKTADAGGLGPNNPGVMDTYRDEWAGTGIHDQMPGPDFGNIEPSHADDPLVCDHCGDQFASWNDAENHRLKHINDSRFPQTPQPVVDLDAVIPPSYDITTQDSTNKRQASLLRALSAAPKPSDFISGPVPILFDLGQDRAFVGEPGSRHTDIRTQSLTPGAVVEGVYDPKGQLQIRADGDVPYTISHLLMLWQTMYPHLPVKAIFLLSGDDKKYKVAASDATDDMIDHATTADWHAGPALRYTGDRDDRKTVPAATRVTSVADQAPAGAVGRRQAGVGETLSALPWRDASSRHDGQLPLLSPLSGSGWMAASAHPHADETGRRNPSTGYGRGLVTGAEAGSHGREASVFHANRKRDFADAIERGWQLEHLDGGHMRLYNRGHKVGISATPSDSRADKNANAQIRRCERGVCDCRGDEIEPLNPVAPEAQVEPDSTNVPQVGRTYRVDGVDYQVTNVDDPHAMLMDAVGHEILYDFRSRERLSKHANVLDEVHEGLDPAVFDDPNSPEPRLKDEIADHVTHLIHKTMIEAGWPDPEDYLRLVLTGSLTTYQYSAESDFDVSLWVDSARLPEWQRSNLVALMVSKLDGTNIGGHPLQVFVVAPDKTPDDLYKPGLRSAWDLAEQRWLVPPEPERTHDVYREWPVLIEYAKAVADKMRVLLQYNLAEAKRYWHEVHEARRASQARGEGDYSAFNVAYKWLFHTGVTDEITRLTGEHIAARPDSDGQWLCPNCGEMDRDGVLDDEEGFSCRKCGATPKSLRKLGWVKTATPCKHCDKPATLNLKFEEGDEVPVCPRHEVYETGVRGQESGERPKYRRESIESDPPWRKTAEWDSAEDMIKDVFGESPKRTEPTPEEIAKQDADRKQCRQDYLNSFPTEPVETMRHAEYVPTEALLPFREYDWSDTNHRDSDEDYQRLKDHIAKHGINEPTWLDYDPDSNTMKLSEGNHRLAIANELGISHVPVIGYRVSRPSKYPNPYTPDTSDINRNHMGELHWPSYIKPHQIGLPVREVNGTHASSWRTAMADRTGVPEIDALIEEYLKTPMGDWTTDGRFNEVLRDPADAAGMCEAVSADFAQFAKARGWDVAVTATDLDDMGYKPTGEPVGEIMNEHGNEVPGFYYEHTVNEVYRRPDGTRFYNPITIDWTASQYGYTDHPKVSSWSKVS